MKGEESGKANPPGNDLFSVTSSGGDPRGVGNLNLCLVELAT